MTRYHAAKETEMHSHALAGFEELVVRGEEGATGPELFGDAFRGARWAYSMMRRLTEAGLVRAAREERRGQFGNKATVYRPTPALTEVVATGNVSSLVWRDPAALDPSSPQESPASDKADDEDDYERLARDVAHNEDPQAPLSEATEAPGDDALDVEEALGALLKMTSALLEHAVSLSTEVATLRKEVTDLKKSWE